MLSAVFKHELQMQWRKPARWLMPLGFYLLVSTLFVLGSAPTISQLQSLGPTVIWVAVLLAVLMLVEHLFTQDLQNGTLDLYMTSQYSLSLIVLAKLLAVVLIILIPLVLMTPIVMLFFSVSWQHLPVVLTTVILVVPSLLFIGAIGAALTCTVNRGGAILALIVLPLYIPVLIFATRAIQSSLLSLSFSAELYFLSAILVLSISLAPLAISAALRLNNQ